MSVLLLSLVVLLGRFVAPAHPVADVPAARPERVVVLDEHVRDVLRRDWDAHAHDPVILERAYCVTFREDAWYTPGFVYRVTDIAPADSVEGQTPHSIRSFYCSPDANVTSLHLHPPQTCISDTECVDGGSLAWQCMPSDVDRASLRQTGKPFALIICDRNATIAFYP